MAKKSLQKTKPKTRGASSSDSVAKLKKLIAAQAQEIREGGEREAATGEILRMIARSQGDLQSIMDAIAESAARLCEADDALVRRLDGERYYAVSHYGSIPIVSGIGVETVCDRSTPAGRAVSDKKTIHVPDLHEAAGEYPGARTRGLKVGVRTALAAPLLLNDRAIGSIHIRRLKVSPFSERQIKLLETFANHAVIAIENARLFHERESRNRDLAALHDVTAAASQSLEIKPILDEVVKKITEIFHFDAVRIFLFDEARETLNALASFGLGERATAPMTFRRGKGIQGRVAETGEPIIFENVNTDPRYLELSQSRSSQRDYCFFGIFPIKVKARFAGTISCLGKLPRKLTREEVRLINSMCDQIGVAVDNINLFEEVRNKSAELESSNSELREALEQQTATSEVLRVIASSPTDLQPVLDNLLANAVKLSGATKGHIRQHDGEMLRYVAHYNESPELVDALNQLPQRPRPDGMGTRALVERKPIHVLDAQAEPSYRAPVAQAQARTMLIVPLLREESGIGTITIWRDIVDPFTERQIELVKTFADQAVIAIENVRLFQELQARNRDLTEALEQQTATSEILRVIASSPTEIQSVMDNIAENAARLCGADDVLVRRTDGVTYQTVSHFGSIPHSGDNVPVDIGSGPGRAILERRIVHVEDIQKAESEFPGARTYAIPQGIRTVLAVPLLRDGIPLGVLHLRRLKVLPFTDNQIALLKTFADQAVIAIENVRLFQELQDRNRDLTEALEQQTATSEILSVIASSPTDIQPVLDAVTQNAARLCDASDAQIRLVKENTLQQVASYGTMPATESRVISRGFVGGRAIIEKRTIHIDDLEAEREPEYPETPTHGNRTVLAVPLLREGEPIGVINVRRVEVRPFTDKQIKLLETFADQAVIAIENVRLFKELQDRNAELREALEHQTATAEVLGIISRSPTDVQPVLDAIVESVARVCGIDDVMLRLRDGNTMTVRAHFGSLAVGLVEISIDGPQYRWVREHGTLHIPDARAEQNDFPMLGVIGGFRTFLAVPLRQQGELVGTLNARCVEVRPFTPAQVKLLETFADQALIAIENVRLFNELKESLEQQTATSEILGVIASSPTDLQPVLDALAENAARVCNADDAVIRLVEGTMLRSMAHYGPVAEFAPEENIPVSRGRPVGRTVTDGHTIHVIDLAAEVDSEFPESKLYQLRFGTRTILSTPLLREGVPLGAIVLRRQDVRPFTDKQIKQLETFAHQAVIAIENVRLFKELQERNRDLTEALEQQTATSEILRVIASSPTDIQPVLDAVAENAARLCDSKDAFIWRRDNDVLRMVATYGRRTIEGVECPPIDRTSLPGRAVVDGRTIHIEDLRTSEAEFPWAKEHGIRAGVRTSLVAPLLSKGIAIGAIHIRRWEVRPFTDKQIKLFETFADQAVIAIENVRLFKELQERNAELREALEHQTATAEVLGIISRSPTDVQPVLDAIVESAARVCGIDDVVLRLHEGNTMVARAHFGPIAVPAVDLSSDRAEVRWIREHGTLHVPDTRAAQNDFPMLGVAGGWRTFLSAPLRLQGEFIGNLAARRTEVRPFTPVQIKLLETFADQAVIAIENVRLFNELKESLEQQTATSEILGVIASSPTDIQPVLDVVAANAVRLCEAKDAVITHFDAETLKQVVQYGTIPVPQPNRLNRHSPVGRAIVDRKTIHVDDLLAEIETEYPGSKARQQLSGTRTMLVTPLLREGVPIGTINIRRTEVRPFSEKQIKLLETFADQAVIAVENVRLFKELEERNRQITEALEQQTATSEILRVIASSPTNIQPVLDVVAENAARLCDAHDAIIHRLDGDRLQDAAHYGPISRTADTQTPLNRDSVAGRAVVDRGVVHVQDIHAESETEFPLAKSRAVRDGTRSVVGTPLLREGVPIGAILIRRTEVRPFTEKQIALLKTFADQAVIAIENVRLFKELQERTRELVESVEEMKALSEVGQAVSSSLDLATVLETIVARAVDLSRTDCGVIYEYDEEAQEFNLRASHRMEAEAVEGLRAARIKLGEGATGQAALTRTPVQIVDTFGQREGSVSRLRPLLHRLGYRSLLTVPILRDHQIMGGLTVWRRQAGEFEPEVVNLLQTFATQSALAIHNARLFREIEAKGRELEAANQHKSEFLANVSHELRTPLNAIIGFSEVLQERLFGELNEKQAEYTEDILSSGRHLLSLINDILDLSKIEAGRMELEVTTFHLPDAIENALLLIRERASRHGIKLDRVIDDHLSDFTGDERKVKQILVNLLTNAVKFTPEGGQIRVEARLGDSAVIISVADTGIGIAPEDQEAIFEEFRQVGTNYAQKREGTGLGLALTRKFVELHGGKIWVESEVGRGSTFTFALPIK